MDRVRRWWCRAGDGRGPADRGSAGLGSLRALGEPCPREPRQRRMGDDVLTTAGRTWTAFRRCTRALRARLPVGALATGLAWALVGCDYAPSFQHTRCATSGPQACPSG